MTAKEITLNYLKEMLKNQAGIYKAQKNADVLDKYLLETTVNMLAISRSIEVAEEGEGE